MLKQLLAFHQTRKASIVAGVLMCTFAGSLLSFNSYSEVFKDELGLDQTETNLAISIGNIGFLLVLTVGLLYDYAGPRWSAFMALVLSGLGYLLLYISLSVSSWTLAVFSMFIVGQGASFGFSTAYQTQVVNYPPHQRGRTLGVCDAVAGLSPAFVSAIYNFGFSNTNPPNLKGFFLFLAFMLMFVNFVGVVVLRPLPWKMEPLTGDDLYETEEALIESSYEGITGLELLKTSVFWLFIVADALSVGLSITFQNSLGSLLLSMGHGDLIKTLSITTPLISASSRFLSGLCSDLLLPRFQRAVWLLVGEVFCVVAWFSVVVSPESKAGMVICSVAIGIGYGMTTCIGPTLTSEMWGTKHYGKNNGVVALFMAAVSLIFQLIFGNVYENHQEVNSDTCLGVDCYQSSFILGGVFQLIAVIAGVGLYVQLKKERVTL